MKTVTVEKEPLVRKLLEDVSSEIETNSKWLRDDTPKSERRISVLHARIEMLIWVRKRLEIVQCQTNQKVKEVKNMTHKHQWRKVGATFSNGKITENKKRCLTCGETKP